MPKKKKTSTAAVSTPSEADEVVVVESVDAEAEVVASTPILTIPRIFQHSYGTFL